jgi:hypothetical protein
MNNCPTCGNPLNGEDPRFCYFCEKLVEPVPEEILSKNSKSPELDESSHNFLDKCPSCGKLFAGEVVKKELIDSTISKADDLEGSGRVDKIPTEFDTYRYYYRCKHCSNQWTKEVSKREILSS